jgi:hypothetical protein
MELGWVYKYTQFDGEQNGKIILRDLRELICEDGRQMELCQVCAQWHALVLPS